MQENDVPALKEIYTQAGYAFDFPDFRIAEEALVAVDSEDRPILGVFAMRTVEMIMVCDQNPHPTVRMQAIGLVHQEMQQSLVQKGWQEAISLVGPHLKAYGRHMSRKFGWLKDFTAYRIRG